MLGADCRAGRDAEDDARRERGSVGIGTPGSLSRATGLLRGLEFGVPQRQADRAPISRRVLGARGAHDQRRQLLRAVGGERRRGRGRAASCSARYSARASAAGIVVHGRVLDGRNGIAGEWGHNPLPWPHDDERPGAAVLLRPPRLHRDVPVRARASSAIIARVTGDALPRARDRRARAAKATLRRRASLQRYEERLARALAHVINILDPDVIVLGGGMSNVDALYASVPRAVGRWVFSDRVDTRAGAATRTATRAACAARRGCGRR